MGSHELGFGFKPYTSKQKREGEKKGDWRRTNEQLCGPLCGAPFKTQLCVVSHGGEKRSRAILRYPKDSSLFSHRDMNNAIRDRRVG